MNLMQFVSTVVNVMQIFDPQVGHENGEMMKITSELGLMRGDAADDVGKVRTMIKPYAEIDCLTKKSDISTRVECRFVPRS